MRLERLDSKWILLSVKLALRCFMVQFHFYSSFRFLFNVHELIVIQIDTMDSNPYCGSNGEKFCSPRQGGRQRKSEEEGKIVVWEERNNKGVTAGRRPSLLSFPPGSESIGEPEPVGTAFPFEPTGNPSSRSVNFRLSFALCSLLSLFSPLQRVNDSWWGISKKNTTAYPLSFNLQLTVVKARFSPSCSLPNLKGDCVVISVRKSSINFCLSNSER